MNILLGACISVEYSATVELLVIELRIFNFRITPDCSPKQLLRCGAPAVVHEHLHASYLCRRLTLSGFFHFYFNHPDGQIVNHVVILICISLITNDVAHLFVCLFAIC